MSFSINSVTPCVAQVRYRGDQVQCLFICHFLLLYSCIWIESSFESSVFCFFKKAIRHHDQRYWTLGWNCSSATIQSWLRRSAMSSEPQLLHLSSIDPPTCWEDKLLETSCPAITIWTTNVSRGTYSMPGTQPAIEVHPDSPNYCSACCTHDKWVSK